MIGTSVLTLVKNRPAHLRHLVEGLRRSDVQPDELIVISMDDERYSLPETLFPTRVLNLPTDGLLLAQARNMAAGSARYDHLLFLDVDCIPMRTLTGAMSHALSLRDALVCADVLYLAAGEGRGDWTQEELLRNAKRHPVRHFPPTGVREEHNVGLFWSLAFGIRRDRFHTLGGFDEAFVGYGAEDTDFAFRARAAGTPLLFLGDAGAFHQYHDLFDPPLQHFDAIIRNAQLFHDKWKIWPMGDWLNAFATMGLIEIANEHIRLLRAPALAEIAAARKPPTARY